VTPFLPLERVEPDISGTHGLNPVTLALPRQQEALSEKQRLLGAKGAKLDAQAAAMLVEAKALDAEAQVLADEAAQALILSQQPFPPLKPLPSLVQDPIYYEDEDLYYFESCIPYAPAFAPSWVVVRRPFLFRHHFRPSLHGGMRHAACGMPTSHTTLDILTKIGATKHPNALDLIAQKW